MVGARKDSRGMLVALEIAIVLGFVGCSAPDAVKVVETFTGPYTIAYREHIGDYAKTAPVFAELREALSRRRISPGPSIGIYLDDPKKVPAADLRCICGAVIEESDQGKLEGLRGLFKIERISGAKRLVAECRYKGRSPSEGSSRYYAALFEYAKRKAYLPFEGFELYEAGRTSYVMPARELEYDYQPRGASDNGPVNGAAAWPDPEWRASTSSTAFSLSGTGRSSPSSRWLRTSRTIATRRIPSRRA